MLYIVRMLLPVGGRIHKVIPHELNQSHECLSASESILHSVDTVSIT